MRTLGDVANGKDVGASLRDNLKGFVVAAVSAELFKAIGDLSGAENWNLSEGSIEKIVLHATAGCAIGAAASKDCFAGALGAGLQEALSGVIDDLSVDPNRRAQYAGLIASTATFLAGGDSTAIGTANQTANTAREFNRELHAWESDINKQLAEKIAKKKGTTVEEELEILEGISCAIVQCGAGALAMDPASPEYLGLLDYLRETFPDYMKEIDAARMDERNVVYVPKKGSGIPYLWYDSIDGIVDRDVPIETIYLEDFTPGGFGKKLVWKGISELGIDGIKLLLVTGTIRGKTLGSELIKEWTIKSRLKNVGLPTQGKIRFVPDKGYSPSNPMRKGDNGGYLDRFENEWIKGPSRTSGQPYEWDVRLSTKGKAQLGWISPDKNHINVSLDGKITHK